MQPPALAGGACVNPTSMGDLAVRPANENRAPYLRSLLRDIQALELMVREDRFEQGRQRIGAEQELCLVDASNQPDPRAYQLLPGLPPAYTTEIGRFNLEANLDPFDLDSKAFQQTEAQLRQLMNELQALAHPQQMRPIMTGILPTIQRCHLDDDYMTPLERYSLLNEGLSKLRGGHFEIRIQGTDELVTAMPSVMYEAANTSWQLHLQLDPHEFAEAYNWAQYIAGPVMAATANSPLLFGRELWHETRIALFQQSIDTRRSTNQIRDRHNRVNFGREWLLGSPAQLFKDNVTRFPLVLTGDVDEDAFEALEAGRAPKLRALRLHNGTIYSWNRTCYGISDTGYPHLRIENRYIPAGPTISDEMANFAFWIGLMKGMPDHYRRLPGEVPFQNAKSNFYRAARTSLHAYMEWNKKHRSVRRVLLEELLPIAKEGLQKVGVAEEEINHRLGIIERRVSGYANGACWIGRNFRALSANFGAGLAVREITAAMLQGQSADMPVHNWPDIDAGRVFAIKKGMTAVANVMKTDLYTIQEEEPIGLARAIMEWKKVRHLPIEDEHGQLIGLLTRTNLEEEHPDADDRAVSEIMVRELITIEQYLPIRKAATLMREHGIGCLPIVEKGQIIGLLTDTDFNELFGNDW